ncbi:MAG: hypothetical protein ACOY7T_12350 [Pseudomonadota bacterium]
MNALAKFDQALPEAAELPPAWANDLVLAVCRAFEVRRDDLLGLSRAKHLVLARQSAAWLLRVRPKPGQTGYAEQPRRRSYPEIGRILRLPHLNPIDHGTLLYGCVKVAERAARDAALRAVLQALAWDAPAHLPAVELPKGSLADHAKRQRAKWRAEVQAVLGARHAPLRPVMELAEGDSDALARAAGSLRLTAALDAELARRAVVS